MLSTVHFDIILIQCIPHEKNHSPTTEKNHFDQYTNIKLCIKTKLFPIISLIIQACLKTFSFNNVKTERRATEKLVSFIRKLLTSTKISYGNDWQVFFINFHMLESILLFLLKLIITALVQEIFERKRCRISFPRLCIVEPRKNPV